MITKLLDRDTKAFIIELADIFLEMDVEEITEDMDEKEEFAAHIKVINSLLKKAKEEGYGKYALYTRKEAEARKQNLGLNGMYLLVVKK